MSKPFKIVLGVVAGFFGLLVIAAIALPLLFDPNNFRGKLSATVGEKYHRQLELGDIKLSVFPWLRVKVADVKLGNAPGFGGEPFAQVGEMSVGVHLLPLLLHRQVEASAITLSGLRLNLAKNAQGQSNWADLTEAEKPAEAQPVKTGQQEFALADVNISGIEVRDAALSYADAATGKHYAVEHLNLKTGALRPGQPFDVDLSLALSSQAPEALIELKLGGNVLADASAKTYAVNGLALTADLSGGAVPGGKQSVKLSGDLSFNQATGAMKFSKAELQAAGVTAATELTGAGLLGDTPTLAGPITIQPFSPREVMSRLGMKAPVTADPNALTQASLAAQYRGDFKSAALSALTLKLDQTTVTGSLGVRDFATQAIEFALKADQLDADRYLAPKSAKAADQPAGGGKKADINSIKLPTEALDALNVNGTLELGTLKASGLKMSNVRLKIAGDRNSPKQQELSANLYGGQLKASTRIGGGKAARYALKTQIQTISAGPLLQDFLGKDYVSGLGTVTLDLTSGGATVGDLRRALNGTVGFNLQNGAVKGFNLGQVIRNAQSLVAGQAMAQDGTAKETDFASLAASARIVNGILQSDSLDAKSPLFRLAGAGEIDLVNETIDYTARPTIVETSQGQGGKALDQLRGLTIPIKLSGKLFAPKVEVAIADALKEKATAKIHEQLDVQKDRLRQKLQEQLGDDLGKSLGDLFRRKPAEPQPQPKQPGT